MPATPPLDPDRDEARRLLQHELETGTYQLQESVVVRVWRWFTGLFPDLSALGPLPGWVTWAVLGVVLVAVLAVLAFATRDRWRTGRLHGTTGSGAVLEGRRRGSDEYRSAARRALQAGDHGTAVLEAYRALTAAAIERTLLEDRPGRTAHEVALGLAPAFPPAATSLLTAADAFDAVRYGGRTATPAQARAVIELDERLQGMSPVLAATGASHPPSFTVPR